MDLTEFTCKPKRINVSLLDGLIQLIDTQVKASQGQNRDCSHLLVVASRHQLEEYSLLPPDDPGAAWFGFHSRR
ncbi:hypothetical protein [Oceanimonas doudoroffii]|uniref:hypothetical protein n=1 Tax=Oceanimonas doudoroffii TaxID=84158 RepID=UPI00146DA8A4